MILSLSTTTIVSSIAIFLLVIFSLVSILLFVKSRLMPAGKVKISINGEKEIEVDGGSTLLNTLSNEGEVDWVAFSNEFVDKTLGLNRSQEEN